MPSIEPPADYYLVPRNGAWDVHLDGFGLIAEGFDTYADALRAAHAHSFTLSDEIGAAA